jgi:hypothetical protein
MSNPFWQIGAECSQKVWRLISELWSCELELWESDLYNDYLPGNSTPALTVYKYACILKICITTISGVWLLLLHRDERNRHKTITKVTWISPLNDYLSHVNLTWRGRPTYPYIRRRRITVFITTITGCMGVLHACLNKLQPITWTIL